MAENDKILVELCKNETTLPTLYAKCAELGISGVDMMLIAQINQGRIKCTKTGVKSSENRN